MSRSVIRFIALIGSMLLLLLPAAGCGGSHESHDATSTPSSNVSNASEEQVEDLGGFTFKVVSYANARFDPDVSSGDPVAVAAREALDEVEQLYNCRIEFESVSPNEIFTKVQAAVMANDKYADLIITTQWAFGYLMGAGMMQDLKKIDTLNLDNPWWVKGLQEAATINGKVYANAGSFTPHITITWATYFNKQIWKELNLPDPYQLVREGKWTYPKFLEFAEKAMKDNDGDGQVNSLEDRWGLITPLGDFSRAIFMAQGGHFYQTNPQTGKVELACKNQRAYDIAAFMRKLAVEKRILRTASELPFQDIAQNFMENKALFMCASPGVDLKNMEADWGILPQPKYNEEQETYIGCVDHNSEIFGVTNTNTDLHQVGLILEALGRRFVKVEQLMLDDWADSYWRSPEDDEMIRDYIYNHGGYDLALISQNANRDLSRPMSVVFGSLMGNTDFASAIEAIEPIVNDALNKYFGSVETPPTATTTAATEAAEES